MPRRKLEDHENIFCKGDIMIEEKLSRKVTVLFPKTIDNKINEICRNTERTKSNLIRYIVSQWVEKATNKGI